MKLSNATLSELPEAISVPSYDRTGLTPGIVHIGLGNFHRAHQAWYTHRLMQQGMAHDWAIIGAGVRPGDMQMRERLLAQDCLTTLIELDPSRVSAEVTGSMVDFLPVEEGNLALVAAMSDPAIRIVSLTVTEGGYYLDADGQLDSAHPEIAHDAAHPDTPRTAFGAMVAALKARRAAGHGAFTGLCCDNLQGNGAILRQTVVGLAMMSDPDLANWIDENGAFPETMVDCIVPATGEGELSMVRDLGVEDDAPVTHENFRQWVIEDTFCAGRPPWEKAGATLTDDVHPYESMKLRILNAGHQVLANVGEVLGLHTIADCMGDPLVSAFFRKVQTDEILPFVHAVEGMPPERYLDLVERRFSNPKIRDTTRRVAFDGVSRHPGFVFPTVRDALREGGRIDGLALVEALWARMCSGVREDGSTIESNDTRWVELVQAAEAAKDTPEVWLALPNCYGDLSSDADFRAAFSHWLNMVWSKGARATIETYLAS